MSELKVNKVSPRSGTSFTLGDSGDTFTVPSGATLTTTDATVNLPATQTVTTELKTNKISPASGTAFTFGDSGDTFTIPAGATIANSGTATGFGSLSSWSESSGNLLPSNASYGIYLGVNSATAANLLDDFEEGDFTPQYRGSAGSAGSLAYSSQQGRYTKIGRLVFIQIRLILSNNGSFSSGGQIEIFGLPFTVANEAAPPPASLELRKVSVSEHTAYASFSDGNTYAKIKVMESGNNPASVTHSATVSDSGFLISGMYITS